MHASAFHSREVREYFAHPSGLVTSLSSCFLPIYPFFSEQFIRWVHLVDRVWVVP